jgi:hypothetical protein
MWPFGKPNVSLLTERGTKFSNWRGYKHLDPSGAKTKTSKNSDRVVARS